MKTLKFTSTQIRIKESEFIMGKCPLIELTDKLVEQMAGRSKRTKNK